MVDVSVIYVNVIVGVPSSDAAHDGKRHEVAATLAQEHRDSVRISKIRHVLLQESPGCVLRGTVHVEGERNWCRNVSIVNPIKSYVA